MREGAGHSPWPPHPCPSLSSVTISTSHMSVGQQLACPSSGHSSVGPEPPFWKERGFPLDSGHTVGTGLSCTRRNAILDSRTWEDELLQGRSKGFHPGCFPVRFYIIGI